MAERWLCRTFIAWARLPDISHFRLGGLKPEKSRVVTFDKGCHQRSYGREDFVFDPLHYLALLEQKPGALDQAAPLAGWQLPDGFGVLRRLSQRKSERLVNRRPKEIAKAAFTYLAWRLKALESLVEHQGRFS